MKSNTKITLAAFLTGMTLIGASSAFARDGGQGNTQAAIAACVGQAEGSKVSVPSIREAGKNVEATCKMGRDKVLMARPEHKKGR